jgi:hypothetical protein
MQHHGPSQVEAQKLPPRITWGILRDYGMVFDFSKVVVFCWGVLPSMQVEVKSENIPVELEPDNTGARNRTRQRAVSSSE